MKKENETGYTKEFNKCFTVGEKIARVKYKIEELKIMTKGYEEALEIFENELKEETK
jgi:hypothetical protein